MRISALLSRCLSPESAQSYLISDLAGRSTQHYISDSLNITKSLTNLTKSNAHERLNTLKLTWNGMFKKIVRTAIITDRRKIKKVNEEF